MPFFEKSIPVWAQGEQETLNYQLVLCTHMDDVRGCEMRIAAAMYYRLRVNGVFAAFGPARTAEGYARVDCIDLTSFQRENRQQEIVLEVAGYHCRSLSTVLQPSFVVAEVHREGCCVLSSNDGFEAFHCPRRVQRVERYSAQRHFGEIWDERVTDPFADAYRVDLAPVDTALTYLPRRVPYASCRVTEAAECAFVGCFHQDDQLPCVNNKYSMPVTRWWGCFDEAEIASFPYRWLQKQAQERSAEHAAFPLVLHEGMYAVVDFGRLHAGFLTWNVEAMAESDLVIAYSEMCLEKDFEWTGMSAQNVLETYLPAGGSVSQESFEPYTMRFVGVFVRKGSVVLRGMGVRSFENPMQGLLPHCAADAELEAIWQAAATTFAHNAVDLYTDCPSRERAGWLCDSYFTGKAEYALFGRTDVEDAFLENYRLCRPDSKLPDGALPMCYPSDVEANGKFIPQWDMWYVLEVADYLTNRQPTVDKTLYRDSVMGILHFLQRHENDEGLLERLPSWNFVEWSKANEWTWDVNYPTNFLYAEVLTQAGRLYDLPECLDKAQHLRRLLQERAFDGEVFVDHAVRDEAGVLRNQPHCSEAGQYYALLFGEIDVRLPRYERLMQHVRESFANFDPADRTVVPVNAFIGFYLRMAVLLKLEEKALLKADVKSFFGSMVDETGTLWEHRYHRGSYDHGFASYAVLAIDAVSRE